MKRRKLSLLYFLLTGGGWLILCAGCNKQQVARTAAQTTMLQYLAQDSDFTIVNAAIQRCQLDTLFASGGPFTFFCPVDSAFLSAGLTKDSIEAWDPVRLSYLLKYHILSGKFSSADLTGFLTESATSYDTLKPYLTKNYYGMFFDGIKVYGTTELGDGVVQAIGQLAAPSASNLLQVVDSLPELSYFAAVLQNAPDLLALFNTPGPVLPPVAQRGVNPVPGFTMLVPTNDAFLAFGRYPTIASIQQEDPAVLEGIFEPYCLNGFLFTSNFMGGYYPGYTFQTPINPYEFFVYNAIPWVVAPDGLTILPDYSEHSSSGTTNPQIVHGNILGANGVIHEIDQIFL